MRRAYIKYPMDYTKLFRILDVLKKRKVNFFVDLQSIAVGFYNKNNVFMELSHFVDNGNPSDTLIQELKDFLNRLYKSFKRFDPYFIIFYDDGYCQQNRTIFTEYKCARSNLKTVLMHDEEVELFRQIKKHYYQQIEEQFTKQDLSKVYYLREYEADFIPYYCVVNELFDSKDSDILNIILSNDKDLMQTCQFTNTVQCTVTYNKKNRIEQRTPCNVWDDSNALQYIKNSLKVGLLTAKYIPMLLSIAGDRSDDIPGIKSIGPKKAFDLIVNNNIPHRIEEVKSNFSLMPDVIKSNIDIVERNFKLIDFGKQIERLSIMKKSF
jgi:5'-3' exonuclease